MTKKFRNTATRQQATEQWTIEGEDVNGVEWSMTFTSLVRPPAGALHFLGQAIDIRNGNVVYLQQPSLQFIRATLIKNDEARFDAMVLDKERFVQMDTIGQVVEYLTEVVAGGARPTSPSPDSLPSSDGPTDTSEDASPSPGTSPESPTD